MPRLQIYAPKRDQFTGIRVALATALGLRAALAAQGGDCGTV